MYFKPIYKLCDWVDEQQLFIRELSHNPKSIDYLKQNIELITWKYLSINENAMEILENNLDKIDWNVIYSNKNAVYLLKKYILTNNVVLKQVQWNYLCTTQNCMEIFNIPKIKEYSYGKNYFILSKNQYAIPLLEQNLGNVEWSYLSANPGAIELLKNNISKIDWDQLSKNPYLQAIELLKENLSKINWWSLNNNPNGHMILHLCTFKTPIFNK